MSHLYTLEESGNAAAETFRTFLEGTPALIPTGISALDATIGGLGPGTTMIIGAGNGTGKSSVALDMALNNQKSGVKTGIISCEDGADMVGCRLLGRYAGVDSRKIRTKRFNSHEYDLLQKGHARLQEDARLESAVLFSYEIGQSLERVQGAVQQLADAGCQMVCVDYIQKIRGASDDRRNEVSRVFTWLHKAAADAGVSLVLLSQVTRAGSSEGIPRRNALKESGDLENEARVIVMLGSSGGNESGIDGLLDKCSMGGEGQMFRWNRGACGGLFEATLDNTLEEVEDDF